MYVIRILNSCKTDTNMKKYSANKEGKGKRERTKTVDAHLPTYRCIFRDFNRATLCARCPSVCPSVTFVYCIQMAEDIFKLLSRSDSRIILVF